MLAPPLIALPGISPVNGEKVAGGNFGALSSTLAIGETDGDSVFLPVTIRGEMSGRTMRGSACLGSKQSFMLYQ
ncbi:hypothetical protein [Mesorhizobium australafricanum]|uniref:Uncharacterized protein n=1 Tax=Mesorhizobium australafricanum TaxID=3072311 RepID=A0ABU4X1Y1_9HYPH|nr:hypothetical protein [Mesorhizobium sp. VK3E]MDX8441187.1 hypothetical protein [Mesorhizobium sp. VK3E]